MRNRLIVSLFASCAVFAALAALAGTNLITGDGGRSSTPPDMSRLNLVRAIYDSEGGMGEAYYAYDGRVWARWETDFPQGDDNFGHRLTQLTRINVAAQASSRLLTAPDLGDFPLLYMSDPGYMVISEEERAAFEHYLARGGFVWVDDFWGDAEWQQFANVMRTVLPNREWRVLTPEHPIFHTVFDLNEMPQIPALPFASPGGSTAESPGAHKFPAGSLDEAARCAPGWTTMAVSWCWPPTTPTSATAGSERPMASGTSRPFPRAPIWSA